MDTELRKDEKVILKKIFLKLINNAFLEKIRKM